MQNRRSIPKTGTSNAAVPLALVFAIVGCGGETKDDGPSGTTQLSPTTAEDAGAAGPEGTAGAGDGASSEADAGSNATGEPSTDGSQGGAASGGALGAGGTSFDGASGAGASDGVGSGGVVGSGGASAVGGAGTSGGGTSVGTGGAGSSSVGSSNGGAIGVGGSATSGGSSGEGSGDLCEWGSYDTDLTDDALSCAEWTTCPAGTYVEESGGFTQDRLCEPCPSGTFGTETDAVFCDPITQCYFGQEAQPEATATTDRACVIADPFTPVVGSAARFVATNDIFRLMVLLYEPQSGSDDTVIENYSSSGEHLDNWIVSDGGDDAIVDMIAIDDEIFVAGMHWSDEAFFVRKLDAEGAVAWEEPIDDLPGDASGVNIAGHDGTLQVAVTTSPDDFQTYRLDRYVFDTDGNPVSSGMLAYPTKVSSSARAIAEGLDGELFVPSDRTISMFDAAGDLIAEPSIDDAYGRIVQVAADGAGGVYALANDSSRDSQILYRFAADGEQLMGRELGGYDLFRLDAFSVTADGILAVGNAPEGPVLLRADLEGDVLSLDVVADFEVARFTGVTETAAGRVIVAGDTLDEREYRIAFVAEWPE